MLCMAALDAPVTVLHARPVPCPAWHRYVFSLLATPVRPFNATERFGERWSQQGGGVINYTDLAAKGVTVLTTTTTPAPFGW